MEGKIVGNYKIDRVLAIGAMGQAFLATHIFSDKQVVIKRLIPEYEFKHLDRFYYEQVMSHGLEHDNIVLTLDVGELEEFGQYIVMQHVNGGTLEKYPISDALTFFDIAHQITEGLIYLHSIKIIHRDLKPANIFIQKSSKPGVSPDKIQVKIGDFGLVRKQDSLDTRKTEVRTFVGTPIYAAPEQLLDSSSVDERADLYSLGMVLYEKLTGSLPDGYRGLSTEAAIHNHKVSSYVRPLPTQARPELDLPKELDYVLLKLLDPEPNKRYQTATAFLADLEKVEQMTTQKNLPVEKPLDFPRTSEGENLVDVNSKRQGHSTVKVKAERSRRMQWEKTFPRQNTVITEIDKVLQQIELVQNEEDWDRVIDLCKNVLKQDSGHRKIRAILAKAYISRGQLYAKEGNIDQAIIELNEAWT